MDFNQAEEQFRSLKRRFEAGDLSEAEFKARLEELMVEDGAGTWWTIGYETERWYRYDGARWVQDDPPGRAASGPTPAADQTAAPAVPGAAAQRRSPIVLAAGALIILALGGYFVFRSAGAKSGAGATPTAATAIPATDKAAEATSTPQPTPEPSQAATPEAAFHVTAVSSQIILYQGPDLRFEQVKTYSRGEDFTVLGRNDDAQWLLVSASDGTQGWVYFQWVEAGFELSLVPTASSVPTLPAATRKPRDGKPTPCSFGC